MPVNQKDNLSHVEGLRAGSITAYKNLLAGRDSQLGALRKTYGPASETWERIENELRDAEHKCRAIYAQLQRPTDGKPISFWWFVLAAVILAALEAPINKFMLDNILRGSNFESYVISLFMTLIMLVLAHLAGHQTRQIRGAYQETVYISNIVVAVVILIVLAMCVGALTIGRAFYTVAGPIPDGRDIFSEISKQVLTVGPWTAFLNALSDKAAFFLASLNTAGITCAFFTAFITHDSDKIYQSALDGVAAASKKLFRIERKYNGMVEKTAKKFASKLANMAAAYGSQNAEIVALKRSRGIALTEEDKLDLTSHDRLLSAMREELEGKAKAISGAKAFTESTASSSDEVKTVSPIFNRERSQQ